MRFLSDLNEDLIHQSTQAGWGLGTRVVSFDTVRSLFGCERILAWKCDRLPDQKVNL